MLSPLCSEQMNREDGGRGLKLTIPEEDRDNIRV